MKFSGYQSRLQLNTATPTVQVSGNPRAYGMGGRPYEQMGNAIGKVGAVVQQKQDEDDAADLMEARNKIMTSLTDQLYNSETGLMTTGVGDNAKGLADRVTDAVHKTTEDVAKDYNGRVQKLLRRNLKENMENFQRNAASREAAEAQKMIGVRYKADLDNGAQLAALNYNNDETIDAQLNEGARTTSAMAAQLGHQSVLPNHLREMNTQIVGSAVKAAMEAEDYERANDLLAKHKESMTQSTWMQLDGHNRKLLEQKRKKDLLEAALMADSYGEAVAMIEDSGLSAAEKKRMLSAARSEFGVSRSGGSGGGRSAGAYTDKQYAADQGNWETINRKLMQGDSISSAQWTAMGNIAKRKMENGAFNEETEQDIYDFYNDKNAWSQFTDTIEKKGPFAAYENLIAGGMTRDAAVYILSEADLSYQGTKKSTAYEDDEISLDEIRSME